ncbi:MAG: protoglobin domain-containing protein [Cyclobacteriaceae bacterium]|nr:protoglobin domain-containing protein [Cyclobacteriaceae bacterium]
MKKSSNIEFEGLESNIEVRKELNDFISKYQITVEDSTRIQKVITPLILGSIKMMIEDFYIWLKPMPEFGQFFGANTELLERVKNKQEEYWIDLLNNPINEEFYKSRVNLAQAHARIDLPLDSYFASLAFFMNWVLDKCSDEVTATGKKISVAKKEDMINAMHSFNKIMQIDQAIVVDNYVSMTNAKLNELINRQAYTIAQLATPIAILAQDVLLVSIIGMIDSNRAQEIMETTLNKIVETTSRVTIIDIAGVDIVDTAIANHIIKMIQAIQLMGCSCILSGVSPTIAQTIVQLGIDLRGITTKSVLKDAVEAAYVITEMNKSSK